MGWLKSGPLLGAVWLAGCGSEAALGSGATGGATTSSDASSIDASLTTGAGGSGAGGSGPLGKGGDPSDGSSSTPERVGNDDKDAARDVHIAADSGAGADAGTQPYKGIANSACATLSTLKSSWWYNWTPTAGRCTFAEFVPMIWGHPGSEQTATGITSQATQLVTAGHQTVLGFNEPDNSTQSNMSVSTAIALWPAFNNPALRIGSPATQANTAGVAWFRDFMSRIEADTTGNLRVDFLAVHWYGWDAGSCDPAAATMEAYLKQIEALPGNRPIWITEYGCLNMSNPDAATVQAFLTGSIAMFTQHPRIERYAWYPWTANNEVVASDGTLTPLGTALAKASSYK